MSLFGDVYFNPIFPVPATGIVLLLAFVLLVVFMALRARPVRDIVFSALRVFCIFLLAFLINLRIMRPGDQAGIETRNLDVLFVLDTTISMWAEDYNGTAERMEGAKADCAYIMEKLAGANFGLIRFDNRGQILAPFTQDTRNVSDAFDTISAPDRQYARGSDLSAPYSVMEDLLESSSDKENRKTIVFFLSDGELTNDAELISYTGLAHYIDDGAVLGYGTRQGGRMREGSYSEYVADPKTGDIALSRIDENNLKRLAADMDIDYVYMEQPSAIDDKLNYIRLVARTTVGEAKIDTFDDTYYHYVFPLLLLLVVELVRQIFFRKL